MSGYKLYIRQLQSRSNPVVFGTPDPYPAPALSAISPTFANQGTTDLSITLTGTNFTRASVVYAGVTALATTYVSDTQLTAVITTALMASVASLAVYVVTPQPGGGTTASISFTVKYRVPSLTSLGTTSVAAGAGDTTISFVGTNLYTGATTAYLGTTALSTTITSSTTGTAIVPTALLASAGVFNFSLTNPTPGGGTSAALSLTVANALPVATSLDVSTRAQFSGPQTGTLTGTGFSPATVVKFDGVAVTTTYVDATHVNYAIPDYVHWPNASYATARLVTATNPTPGGGTSGSLTYTVSERTAAEHQRADQSTVSTTFTWTDLSGNSRHQTATTAQPTKNASVAAANGQPTISYNGSSHTTFSPSYALAQPNVVVAWMRQPSWTNGRQLMCGTKTDANFRAVMFQTPQTPTLALSAGAIGAGKFLPLNQFGLVIQRYEGTSGTFNINSGSPLASSNGTNAIAAGTCIGSDSAGAGFGAVEIAERWVFGSMPTTAELFEIQKYCEQRYLGVTNSTVRRFVQCLGDSITEGLGAPGIDPFPSQLHLYLDASWGTVSNRGIGGQTTTQMLARVGTDINANLSTTKQNFVVVMGGINDFTLGGETNPANIVARLASIVASIKAAATALGTTVTVIVATTTAFRYSGQTTPQQDATELLRQALVTSIKAGNTNADYVLDLSGTSIGNIANVGDTTLYAGDKVHPLSTGENLIAVPLAALLVAHAT